MEPIVSKGEFEEFLSAVLQSRPPAGSGPTHIADVIGHPGVFHVWREGGGFTVCNRTSLRQLLGADAEELIAAGDLKLEQPQEPL